MSNLYEFIDLNPIINDIPKKIYLEEDDNGEKMRRGEGGIKKEEFKVRQ